MALTRLLLPAIALVIASCSGTRHIASAETKFLPVTTAADPMADAGMTAMIAPYKHQLDDRMNEVIAELGVELVKAKPEGTMGNWTADAILHWLQRNGFAPDLTILNYGGQRLPSMQPGPLTVGELYELSPFDNMLLVVEVPGPQLDTLLQHIAGAGGWPISEGCRMVISRGKLGSFNLNGTPIDPARTYRIGMPDYVANGGDGTRVLVGLKQIDTGALVRDVLIEEAKRAAAAGSSITPAVEGRTIVEYP